METFNYSSVKDGLKNLGLSDKCSSIWATYLESVYKKGVKNTPVGSRIVFGSIPKQLERPFQNGSGERFVIIAAEQEPECDEDGNICNRIYVLGLSTFDPKKEDITVMLRPFDDSKTWTILFGLKPDYSHFTF